MKSFVVLAIMFMTFPATNAIAFENDISLGEVKKLAGQTIVQDMAIGDKAYINHYSLCWDDGNLYLSPYGAILEGEKGPYEIAFTMKVGKQGVLSIPAERLRGALVGISRRTSCDIWNNVPHHRVGLIRIDTVNGASKISQLFGVR